MGNRPLLTVLLFIGSLLSKSSAAQINDQNLASKAVNYSTDLLDHIAKLESHAGLSLDKMTNKYLKKVQRQERKLKGLISKENINQIPGFDLGTDSAFNQIVSLGNKRPAIGDLNKWYSSRIDSMKTSLGYITKISGENAFFQNNYNKLIREYSSLNDHLGRAEKLKKLMQERMSFYNDKLSGIVPLNAIKKYQKSVIYFKQSLTEFQDINEHPEKIEEKLLIVLRSQPGFKKYFDKYSELGSIFRLPGQSNDSPQNLEIEGLQSKRMVTDQIYQSFGDKGKAAEAMGKGIEVGQAALSDIRDRIFNSLTTGESSELPGFRPNQQRTKSFIKRLDVGTNFQNNPGNALLPISTDLGLYIGYKLNSKSIIGIGGAYKMGWGKDLKHITITHEGIGVRSFLDYKIKGGFWITGGVEYNFKERFKDFTFLTPIYSWQKSALIGIQKKYKIGKKNGSLSMLYDFFWSDQIPREQPIKFRMGFSFK